jgi:hypothetical protein
MNKFFVKNEVVAKSLDPQANSTMKKVLWVNDTQLDEATPQKGWLVQTPLTRSQLSKNGVMVSSIKDKVIYF